MFHQDGTFQANVYPSQNPINIIKIVKNFDGTWVYEVKTADGQVGYVRQERFEFAASGGLDRKLPPQPGKKRVVLTPEDLTEVATSAPAAKSPLHADVEVGPAPTPTPPPSPLHADVEVGPAPAPLKKSVEVQAAQAVQQGNLALKTSSKAPCAFNQFVAGVGGQRDSSPPHGKISDNCDTFNHEICKDYKALSKDGKYPDAHTFAFIKAIMQQESGYDPKSYRCEKWDHSMPDWAADDFETFKNDKVASAGLTTRGEKVRSFECSYGPMQVLYATAYDQLGFEGKPSDLFDAHTSIFYGIKELLQKTAYVDFKRTNPLTRAEYAGKKRDDLIAYAYNHGNVVLPLNDYLHYIPGVERYMKDFEQCPAIRNGTFCQ